MENLRFATAAAQFRGLSEARGPGVCKRLFRVSQLYALGTRTQLWFGSGCAGYHMLLEHLGMDALLIALTCTRAELWLGHGCKGNRMLLEHKRDSGLGMDVRVTVCSWNTNEILAWHGCKGSRMLLEHEADYGWGMDVKVAVCLYEVIPPKQDCFHACPACSETCTEHHV